MKIALGSDHGGYSYKEAIKKHLIDIGHDVIDVGAFSTDSCHYPLSGIAAGEKVASGEADIGFIVCTSGEGISIAANKVKGVRAAIGYDDKVAEMARRHNDANILAFGEAYMKLDDVLRRTDIFLNTPFEGGRHATRVDMIKDYEKK